MKNTVKINSVDLINADCLHFIQSLPDDSIDLIVTDPPYFKVKPNGWDNQWKGDENYLKWLDHCLAAFPAEEFEKVAAKIEEKGLVKGRKVSRML